MIRKIVCVGCFVGTVILVVGSLFDWVVVEKSWYERWWMTLAGAGVGASLGICAGLAIGGIGLAIAGTGIGLIGWATFGATGLALGASGGSLLAFLANPQSYDIQYDRLILVLAVAVGNAYVVITLLTRTLGWLRSWLADTTIKPIIPPPIPNL